MTDILALHLIPITIPTTTIIPIITTARHRPNFLPMTPLIPIINPPIILLHSRLVSTTKSTPIFTITITMFISVVCIGVGWCLLPDLMLQVFLL